MIHRFISRREKLDDECRSQFKSSFERKKLSEPRTTKQSIDSVGIFACEPIHGIVRVDCQEPVDIDVVIVDVVSLSESVPLSTQTELFVYNLIQSSKVATRT